MSGDRISGESKITWRTILEAFIIPWELKFDWRHVHLSKQIFKYIISGCTVAVVELILLYLFTQFFGIWYIYSAVLAFLFAFFISFSLQKFWTFRDKGITDVHKQASIYLFVSVANLCVNVVALYLLVQVVGLWYMFAQVLIQGAIAFSSFILYKFVIFKLPDAGAQKHLGTS
jgi:putative flippase GtrA